MIKVIVQIVAIATHALFFVNIILWCRGLTTSITLSIAINIKWNIDAKTNTRYKTYEDSDNSSNRHKFDKTIDETITFDNPNIQSETDKLNNVISYIFFSFSLAIMKISVKFKMEIIHPSVIRTDW